MTLVAKLKSTGERIVVGNPTVSMNFEPKDLICQFDDCHAPVRIMEDEVSLYFAHAPESPCATKLETHPDTKTHRFAKLCLAGWLRNRYESDGYENISLMFEVAVPAAGSAADIMIVFQSGDVEAYQIQMAAFTPEDIKRRSDAYDSQAISVIWFVGRGYPADTKSNREWMLKEFGEYPVIDIESHGAVEVYSNPLPKLSILTTTAAIATPYRQFSERVEAMKKATEGNR